MFTLTEIARSGAAARRARLPYEDLALVAHLSELERVQRERPDMAIQGQSGRRRLGGLAELWRGLTAARPFLPKHKRATMGQCC